MGIQSAMYSGVSGLNANSQAMSIIGNNLANTNTLGFKSSRSVFSDLLSSNVSGSGGMSQVGRGVGLSTVDNILSQGTFETTASDTDVAIEGDGFFIVQELGSNADYYTRAGAFRFDADGYLVNPEGLIVQGKLFDPVENDKLLAADAADIQVANVGLIPASATSELTFTTNLNENSTVIPIVYASKQFTPAGASVGNTGAAAPDLDNATNGVIGETITILDDTNNIVTNGEITVAAGAEVSSIASALNSLPGVKATASNEVALSGGVVSTGGTTQLWINGVNVGDVVLTDLNSINAAITNGISKNSALAGLTSAVSGTAVIVKNTTGDDISVGITASGTSVTVGGQLTAEGADGDSTTLTSNTTTAAGIIVPSATDYMKTAGSLEIYLDSGLSLSTDEANGLFATSGVQVPTIPAANIVLDPIDPTDKTSFNYSASSQVYDSLGDAHLVSVYWRLINDEENLWDMAYTVDNNNAVVTPAATELKFNSKGYLDPTNDGVPDTVTTAFQLPAWTNGADTPQTIKISFDCTQFDSDSIVIGQKQNGFSAGSLTNVAINSDGVVVASYSNGKQINVAQLVMAKFQNPGGLKLAGANRYTASEADVGQIRRGIPGAELGKIFTNSLEQSNVDMGQEFVKMITTQRGFSANSKIITTVDEMLSELINLKR